MLPSDDQRYLRPTLFFDYDKAEVRAYADELVGTDTDPVSIAINLYKGTRDDIRYNPYSFSDSERGMSASFALENRTSYCVPKAVLLGAMARYKGIPSRLGLADVRNHLSTPEFIAFLGSNVFVMHGYTELYLEGQWVKATPAFNRELCEKMGVAPLEFNGREDSIFHEYSEDGSSHMEYLTDHGHFDDVPTLFIRNQVQQAYPHIFEKLRQLRDQAGNSSFEADMSKLR